jgi:hypothetical protein
MYLKLKDHEIREMVNELTQVAKEYAGTQQLRERISEVVQGTIRIPKAGEPKMTQCKYGQEQESCHKSPMNCDYLHDEIQNVEDYAKHCELAGYADYLPLQPQEAQKVINAALSHQAAEIERLAKQRDMLLDELENIVGLAEAAMADANRDGAEYLINAELFYAKTIIKQIKESE